MRFRLFTLAATVCVIGVSNFEVVSGAEDLETLLSMLEVRAKATSLVEWQYHSLQLTGMAIFELRTKYPGMDPFTAAHTAGITSFLRDERTISKGKGLVDLKSGKYRFDFVSNQPSNNKNAQAETRTIAYDGTSYSSFIAPQEVKKEKADAGPARTLAPVVEFSKEDLEATNTKVRLFVAGEMFMPSRVPLIPGTLDFRDISTSLLDFVSAVRRNKRIVQFESRSPERWVLRRRS